VKTSGDKSRIGKVPSDDAQIDAWMATVETKPDGSGRWYAWSPSFADIGRVEGESEATAIATFRAKLRQHVHERRLPGWDRPLGPDR
jgi:hypothetical protein